jgi:hypothetical protein
MRRGILAIATVLLLLPATLVAGNLKIVPTTTLQAVTSNNTSAANSFVTQSNGNSAGANISKQDIHTLLYPGSRTRIIAHLMPWFGDHRHMQVGYTSWDPDQIHRQVTDMISRGIDGLVIDWYGPGDDTNITAIRVMQEVEQHPGFTFAIMVDKGAMQLSPCPGCTAQQTLDYLLRYVEFEFIPSPSYMRVDGRPLITNFDIDLHFKVDWSAAVATMTTNPMFIFEDAGGFSHAVTEGSYSWVRPDLDDFGMSYMNKFYKAALQHPQLHTFGAAYKGFNDTLASWSLNRVMGQQCGRTWLETFNKINGMYDSGDQLEMLQLPTWNDYEEGTEVESGIDNCLAVSANMTGSTLKWNVSGKGDEGTVDHYQVYISNDGTNLMPLQTAETNTHSMDLCSFSPSNGNYSVFVQAVGKPNIRNQMSSAVKFPASCNVQQPQTGNSGVHLGATPNALTMHWGSVVASKVSVVLVPGSTQAAVTLSCANLPLGLKCAFNPASVIAGKNGAVSTLTIYSIEAGAREAASSNKPEKKRGTFYAFLLPGMSVFGLLFSGQGARKRMTQMIVIGIVVAAVGGLSSCGNAPGAASFSRTPSGVFHIAVNGDSGGQHTSTNLTLTVR